MLKIDNLTTLGVELPYDVMKLVFALFGMYQHREARRRVENVLNYGLSRLALAKLIVPSLGVGLPALCLTASRG